MKIKAKSFKRKMSTEELQEHMKLNRGVGRHKNKKREAELKPKKWY
jgi:hypothetical protein